MENWKKYLKEGEGEEVDADNDGIAEAEQLYAKYWQEADPYAPDDDPLAPNTPDSERGEEEALQYTFAISQLENLLGDKEKPSVEAIKRAILDGWEEGSNEYMDSQDREDYDYDYDD